MRARRRPPFLSAVRSLSLAVVFAAAVPAARADAPPEDERLRPRFRWGLRAGGGFGPILGVGGELELGFGQVAFALDLGTSGGVGLIIGGQHGGPYLQVFAVALVGLGSGAVATGAHVGFDFRWRGLAMPSLPRSPLSLRFGLGVLLPLAGSELRGLVGLGGSSNGDPLPSIGITAGWASGLPEVDEEPRPALETQNQSKALSWPAWIRGLGVGLAWGRGAYAVVRFPIGTAFDWEIFTGYRPTGPEAIVSGLAGTGYYSIVGPPHRLFLQVGLGLPIRPDSIDEGLRPTAQVVAGYALRLGPVEARLGPELVREVIRGEPRYVAAGILAVEFLPGDAP